MLEKYISSIFQLYCGLISAKAANMNGTLLLGRNVNQGSTSINSSWQSGIEILATLLIFLVRKTPPLLFIDFAFGF